MAARASAVLRAVVSFQHVLALRRRLAAVPRKDPNWPHPDRAVNKGNDRHREELTDFVLSELKDRPDLIEKCVPTYPPYGKRILLDNNWFKTFTRPNVELVTDGIDHFTRNGIVAANGKLRPADIIVISTGFKVTENGGGVSISADARARIQDSLDQ